MKRSWQAFDVLDEDWCPIVQVHGLFESITPSDARQFRLLEQKMLDKTDDEVLRLLATARPRAGLLMECYGISLYDALRETQLQMHERRLGRPLARITNKGRVTVARHVASACRYLHDLGMSHRDLKDQNVLVEPSSGFRAKLTDFGTSKGTRAVLHGEVAGTAHTLAPEALKITNPFRRLDVSDKELDYKPVDVYAFGILLCALWDGGEDARRHMSVQGDTALDEVNAFYNHVKDRVTFPPEGGRPKAKFNDSSLPEEPHRMPPMYVELMQECWRFEPDRRPTFSAICNRLKGELRRNSLSAQSSAALSSAASTASLTADAARVVLSVEYQPRLAVLNNCELRMRVLVQPREAPLELTDEVREGVATFSFPFLARVGQRVAVRVTRVWGDDINSWLGEASCADLFGALPPLPQLPLQCEQVLSLTPTWVAAPKLPAEGVPVACRLCIKRLDEGVDASAVKDINLGVLQLHLLPEGLVRTASRCLDRMPTMLRCRHYNVVVSYRETETGIAGSNFAFRLQEALETEGYSVFCYGAAVAAGQRWLSPFNNGVQACDVFIPICSPEYGDLDKAPWSAAELLQAVRAFRRDGKPAIIPIRHHGEYPSADTLAQLQEFECVPDQRVFHRTPEARRMKYDDVWQLVIARLREVIPGAGHAAAPMEAE